MKAVKLTVKISMYALFAVMFPPAAIAIGLVMALDWASSEA